MASLIPRLLITGTCSVPRQDIDAISLSSSPHFQRRDPFACQFQIVVPKVKFALLLPGTLSVYGYLELRGYTGKMPAVLNGRMARGFNADVAMAMMHAHHITYKRDKIPP